MTKSGAGALALQFGILTAARPGEVRGATWDDFDLQERTWTIPAERMKAGKKHVVPLSDGAMTVLRKAQTRRLPNRKHVFLTGTVDKPMSDMTMSKVLKTMGLKGEATSHGFRSSFRNWSSATFPAEREAAEFSLAHGVRNEVEGAYLTDSLFERRETLMQSWSDYCLSKIEQPDSGNPGAVQWSGSGSIPGKLKYIRIFEAPCPPTLKSRIFFDGGPNRVTCSPEKSSI